ncbi:hypothetical protein [Paenibacillus sp. A14]
MWKGFLLPILRAVAGMGIPFGKPGVSLYTQALLAAEALHLLEE